MSLVVGTDTYVTLAEAVTYVTNMYMPSTDQYVRWFSMSNDNKEVLLRRALRNIDRLPFVGSKAIVGQTLAFPRYPSTSVPTDIKAAQIEEALALGDVSLESAKKEYETLRTRGVRFYRIGNLSESFRNPVPSDTVEYSVSSEAMRLLSRYMTGGYWIK